MSCKIIGSSDTLNVQAFDWGQPASPAAPSVNIHRTAGSPTMPSEENLDAIEEQIGLARQQGVQEGLRRAEAAAQQRLDARIGEINAQLAASLAELAALRPVLRRQAEAQVVDLALHVARRILNRALAMDPDALTGLVSAAISRIDARELLEIRVSAIHHAAVKAAIDKMGIPGQVQVIADPRLEPGAVIIDSGRGRLDASVSTQLAEIERGFADYLSPGGAA